MSPLPRAHALRSILLATLLGTSLLGVLYVGLVYFVLSGMAPPPKMPFDSERWIAAGARSDDETRYQMHEDLIRTHRLVGLARDELAALLGPPTDTVYFREYGIVYHMGPEPGFGVDSVWLVMRLDGDRVVECRVLTD